MTESSNGCSLFVAGDCMDDGNAERPIASPLCDRVRDADLALVNFEAAVAGPDGGDPIPKAGPVKSTGVETPAMLRAAGFDAVTLANNHVMDHGVAGLDRTLSACRDAGVATCGAGSDAATALEPLRRSVDGTSIAVFSFCEQEFGVAREDRPGTAWVSAPDAPQRVATAADEADIVVVVAHGGVEYAPLPPPHRQRQLRRFVEAGADLVVGHHPHVPQGWEVHHGTPIFYSLGNFLFEQSNRPKTRRGLGLELTFRDGEATSVELVPTELDDGVVREIPHDRASDELFPYLYRATEITADRDELRTHWQELAVRLFHQRYDDWLRAGVGTGLTGLHDTVAPDGTRWDGDARQSDLLVLLNLFRNESHRAVVETALAVKTGDRPDRRDPDVRETVRDLVAHTEDRPVYDRPSSTRRKLDALVEAAGRRLRAGGPPTVNGPGSHDDRA